jgi:hypothetical protein
VPADTDKRGGGLKIPSVLFKNFKMIRFSSSFPRLALGATGVLAAISLSPGSAQAFVVTVGGVQYDLSTYTFTPNQYTANKTFYDATFQAQPWYGNNNAAYSFGQVMTQSIWNALYPVSAIQAGSPIDGYYNANIGIISFVPTAGNMMTGPALGSGTLAGCQNSNPVTCLGPGNPGYSLSQYSNLNYGNGVAAITPNSTYVWLDPKKLAPVPGPLPALGAAAAFGFSRKLRKRIKLASGALGSSLPRA